MTIPNGIVTAAVLPIDVVNTQVDMGDQTGSYFSNNPLVFFGGATAVSQPTSPAQIAFTQGQQAGGIYTWGTTQSPTSVSTITTAEKTMTVQSGTVTNADALIATTDLVYINKPTSQAGLWMGNVRASASNQVAVTFGNASAGTLTPTASQVYQIVTLRGVPAVSVTWSPAAVPANTTVEQTIAVSAPTGGYGLIPGQLVQVSKPTQQNGLDIVGCRVVSANVLGVTFANTTAAAITPTASESYTAWSLGGLNALNNLLSCQMNAGTIGAIGAGLVITGGATAFTGLLATDVPVGPAAQPTAQAAATNAAVPALSIISADTLTMYFSGIGSGATPTASLPYTQVVFRQNPAAPLVLYSQQLAPVSVAANTTAEQTFTVTGLVASSAVWVNKPSWQAGLGIGGVRVSAVNTLAINFVNLTASAIVPATETYVIGNFQLVSPGAGNCVYQTVAMSDVADYNFMTNVRAALVNLGLIKGS